jgi:23S rRNA G2445 N2-methylase RlmL
MNVRSLIGVEAYPEVLYAAQGNAQAAGVSLRLAVADPEAFGLRNGKIDRLICNLMRRSGEPSIDLGAFFQEVLRILTPDGLAVIIAEDRQVIGQVLNEVEGMRLLKRRTLHLRGRHPDVYILQKS